MRASTRQIGVCKVCRAPIATVGDKWFHREMGRAEAGHDAIYLEGQRTTPGEGMILLCAWLHWHGYVLACEVDNPGPEIRLDFIDQTQTNINRGPVLHTWTAIPATTWHETYHIKRES